MKKILFLVLALGIFPFQVQAGTEIMQILVFDWDDSRKSLTLKSLGSGTAIDDDLVLTNKHVIEYEEGVQGDFLILCQAQERQTSNADCRISAGVVAVHPEFDVALVRSISSSVFLPKVKVSNALGYKGQNVRIVGFPAPVEGVQNFGGQTASLAVETWLKSPEEGLSIKGDAPTTTRGTVMTRARVKETGEDLLYTNARVNFGNSGGAAFDQFGRYIGIPTFMDSDGNAFILEYKQLHSWVQENSTGKPVYASGGQAFFVQSENQQKVKKTSRWSSRLSSYTRSRLASSKSRAASANSSRLTSRRYSNNTGVARFTSASKSSNNQLKSSYYQRRVTPYREGINRR